MNKLVGLAGRMQSGKDTLGSYLVTEHNYIRVAFADRLKLGLSAILGITLEELEELKLSNEVLPYTGKTVRNMLQTLGTEWGREQVHPKLWNNILEHQILTLQAEGKDVVVTDVRFKNEAELIQSLGGEVTYLIRPSNEELNLHSSENSIKASDDMKIIVNNGTIQELIKAFNSCTSDEMPQYRFETGSLFEWDEIQEAYVHVWKTAYDDTLEKAVKAYEEWLTNNEEDY